ncbi:D-Ala-D-Ala carboxypeptidase family metallohydrolase [Parendozoicomonas haliclonae]|uniref:Peptidase M15 n=1 Tax=Parendozoicomonas haliclonae TaxID=1960125 RepID=A0A1X7AEP1_9GAMM|nr:D-Ala-D-Ala carboxypeptidase family metallohydrolase [Parendozoicomonas haliclonae]SMA33271.1 Peptidase M15 [Parendozoicomonas haliclonae]
MQLTTNFSKEELERSSMAIKYDLDNSIPSHLQGNAYRLAEWLQVLRDRLKQHFGKDVPIVVSSAYRSPALNAKVRGSATSAHIECLAADIKAIGLSVPSLWNFIRENMADVGYDQNIEEHQSWVHIGLSSTRKRRQDLIARREHGETVYRRA